jgi:hypothetical protein
VTKEEAKQHLYDKLLPQALEYAHTALEDMEGETLFNACMKILDKAGLQEQPRSELEQGAKIATASITSALKHLASTYNVEQIEGEEDA